MFLATTRLALGCALLAGLSPGFAADADSFATRAEHAFRAAEQTARREPTNLAALVQFSRTAFEWAEFVHDNHQRAEIATRGIDAAHSAIQLAETNAAAHYWLGMNVGQLARTKSIGALKLVREMESELLRSRSLDPHVDFAGADRSLGMLYRDAPGWPTSIGNKTKARTHLDAAIKLHPEFPDNQLALAESFSEWDDKQNLARQLETTEDTMAKARSKFTGVEWEQSWADWNKRLAELKAKARTKAAPVTAKGVR